MALTPGASTAAVGTLLQDHGALLAARFVLGPLAALGLGWMIHRTLQIPQTMAATGLFYIAILFVMVREILGPPDPVPDVPAALSRRVARGVRGCPIFEWPQIFR